MRCPGIPRPEEPTVQLDIFAEIQKREPWNHGGVPQLFQETLEQAQMADEMGFGCWWEVEHHCTPEFSYSSCPEMMLTAIAMKTRNIHVGHAGVLAPHVINHPLRVAERGAMLDMLSQGRLEMGLAKSGGKEWETFGLSPEQAHEDYMETLRLVPEAWSKVPFEWHSDSFSVTDRDVVPKPVQTPHPPLWATSGSENSFRLAGELGIGVLGTTLFSPIELMAQYIDAYNDGIARCDNPVGKVINNQRAVFTFVHVAKSVDEVIASGAPVSALWYVNSAPKVFNVPRELYYSAIRGSFDPRTQNALERPEEPDLDDLNDPVPVIALLKRMFAGQEVTNEEAFEVLSEMDSVIMGTPETCIKKIEKYQSIGVDRMMCLMQMGDVPHSAVLESIRLAGQEVIPHFQQRS